VAAAPGNPGAGGQEAGGASELGGGVRAAGREPAAGAATRNWAAAAASIRRSMGGSGQVS